MTEAERKLLLFVASAAYVSKISHHNHMAALLHEVETETVNSKLAEAAEDIEACCASLTDASAQPASKVDWNEIKLTAQTATGAALDKLASDFGLKRLSAKRRLSDIVCTEPDMQFRGKLLARLAALQAKPPLPPMQAPSAKPSQEQRYSWAPPPDFENAPEPPFRECKWDNVRGRWVLFSNAAKAYVAVGMFGQIQFAPAT